MYFFYFFFKVFRVFAIFAYLHLTYFKINYTTNHRQEERGVPTLSSLQKKEMVLQVRSLESYPDSLGSPTKSLRLGDKKNVNSLITHDTAVTRYLVL